MEGLSMKPSDLKSYEARMKAKCDKFCKKCNKIYPKTSLITCPCETKLIPYTENIPRCPTCHSADIDKIPGMKKALHGYSFGLLSKTARCQFECNNCGYKW